MTSATASLPYALAATTVVLSAICQRCMYLTMHQSTSVRNKTHDCTRRHVIGHCHRSFHLSSATEILYPHPPHAMRKSIVCVVRRRPHNSVGNGTSPLFLEYTTSIRLIMNRSVGVNTTKQTANPLLTTQFTLKCNCIRSEHQRDVLWRENVIVRKLCYERRP